MKTVIQRVSEASVTIDGQVTGRIGKGFMILIGIGAEDTKEQADWIAQKIANMRIFEDEEERMNLSLKDVGGEILAISQFTLYADCRKGNRPNFLGAGKPEMSEPLYEYLCDALRAHGIHVETGVFGADMKVALVNDGPVTIVLER
ncbi:MAG: D-aminoacyl-tRNA deacylase [Anaerovoracaceae bacterium]